jgi:hypothetical protein
LSADEKQKLRHIFPDGTATPEAYTSPRPGPPGAPIPEKDRIAHAERLLGDLRRAAQPESALEERRSVLSLPDPEGLVLTFQGDPEGELAIKSLEDERAGIRLLATKEAGGVILASVFVPNGKLGHFVKRIEAFRSEDTESGKPKNANLVARVAGIRRAALDELWTDDQEVFPADDEAIWWEVWLRTDDLTDSEERFRAAAEKIGLRVNLRSLRMPDRVIVLAYGRASQMAESVALLDLIAELRRAKDAPSFFLRLPTGDQREWVENLASRVSPAPSGAPAVCLLDTGVNRGHPLLSAALDEAAVLSCFPGDASDLAGHGTLMAGIALYEDLTAHLSSNAPVAFEHVLESVKIFPRTGANDPELYGRITEEAAYRAEVAFPDRERAFCLATSAPDYRDRGMPSSWSAAIDALAAGVGDENRRLVVVAGGNVDQVDWKLYPEVNRSTGIHDPGQAWNALTVGAYTDRTQLDAQSHPDWSLLAAPGTLAPASTTSLVWERLWPLKPDVVLEGGNAAVNPGRTEVAAVDDLSLLSTHFRPLEKLLAPMGDTSAAAAQAARMAAIIQASYEKLWPETVRALLVHSARWTGAMLAEFPLDGPESVQRARLRTYGFGVPDVSRALWSLSNEVTLVMQGDLQPFEKHMGGVRTKEMNLHRLPWPVEALRDLGAVPVTIRVTLSYFVEPNPARRGWRYRHIYPSHGLRFKLKPPTVSENDFRERINRAAREADQEATAAPRPTGPRGRWRVGERVRDRGSIASDCWTGTASEAADCGVIAVVPITGWWRERPRLERLETRARYALVVSIETPETDVDIYAAIPTMVPVMVAVHDGGGS